MKIVVVEDDLMLADFLEEVLHDIGHNVCAMTADVDEAVRLVREHRPDVGLFDMQLRRGECGTDIANRLAATGDLDGMGILYISGEIDRVRKHARFGHACLNKPYTTATLATALMIVRQMADGVPVSYLVPRGMEVLPQPAVAAT